MFKKKSVAPAPTEPVEYPNGTCVKTELSHYYILGKWKKPIKSARVLESWAFNLIANGTEGSVKKYMTSTELGFRAGTYVKPYTGDGVYLISDNLLRRITTPDAKTWLGDYEDKIVLVDAREFGLHKRGEDIT